jgi:hypothetical protein
MTNNELSQMFEMLSGTHGKDFVQYFPAIVKAVDETDFTCDVITTGSAAQLEIDSVFLNAEQNDGFTKIPLVGSSVIVAISKKNLPYVILYSEITKVIVVISDGAPSPTYTTITMQAGSITMNDGSFGGLTKTQELQTQIGKLNTQLQAVITALSAWTPSPNDGGAALKAYFATQIAGKAAGDFTHIENTLITHGK